MEEFTWEFFATLAGGAAAVTLVMQILKYIIPNMNAVAIKITALVLSLAVVFIAACIVPNNWDFQTIVLAVLNGCVVFTETQGLYALTGKALNAAGDAITGKNER